MAQTGIARGGRATRDDLPRLGPRATSTFVNVSGLAGTFTAWDVPLLDRREIIPWYPTAPWS